MRQHKSIMSASAKRSLKGLWLDSRCHFDTNEQGTAGIYNPVSLSAVFQPTIK